MTQATVTDVVQEGALISVIFKIHDGYPDLLDRLSSVSHVNLIDPNTLDPKPFSSFPHGDIIPLGNRVFSIKARLDSFLNSNARVGDYLSLLTGYKGRGLRIQSSSNMEYRNLTFISCPGVAFLMDCCIYD